MHKWTLLVDLHLSERHRHDVTLVCPHKSVPFLILRYSPDEGLGELAEMHKRRHGFHLAFIRPFTGHIRSEDLHTTKAMLTIARVAAAVLAAVISVNAESHTVHFVNKWVIFL